MLVCLLLCTKYLKSSGVLCIYVFNVITGKTEVLHDIRTDGCGRFRLLGAHVPRPFRRRPRSRHNHRRFRTKTGEVLLMCF